MSVIIVRGRRGGGRQGVAPRLAGGQGGDPGLCVPRACVSMLVQFHGT